MAIEDSVSAAIDFKARCNPLNGVGFQHVRSNLVFCQSFGGICILLYARFYHENLDVNF